ncbi:hypothetical protein [Nostoc sp. TCL26-01]|uniref:hypothetical protein n=1 Tax=Nostoc sp. TCL26-01 TaxID=2576904 RepID=UPI002118BD39|nr:hypothetical protein [Nostoc sp. TCL26-01]
MDVKAKILASQKLEHLQDWNEAKAMQNKLRKQRSEQFRSNLFWFGMWVGSGRSGVFMFLAGAAVFLTGGLLWGTNMPKAISCPSQKTLCYQLRWDKPSVILPGQIKQILKDYQRSHQRRRR